MLKKKGPRGPRRPSVRGLQVTAGGLGPHTGTASFTASKSEQDKGAPHSPHWERGLGSPALRFLPTAAPEP